MLFCCVFALLFALAAAGDPPVFECSNMLIPPYSSRTNRDYIGYYITDNDTIYFIASAPTNGWVGIGFSKDIMMPNSDVVIGASDGIDYFLNDRWAVAREQPPIDQIENIYNKSVTNENGVTTIQFSRLVNTSDTAEDLALNECYFHFLYAWGGGVGDYSNPTSITQHNNSDTSYRNVDYCIPDGCVIECQNLTDPENGTVDDATRRLGAVATYSCNEGYALVGESEVICELERVLMGDTEYSYGLSSNWSASEPVRELIVCPKLDSPDNGTVAFTSRKVGGRAIYLCDPGFELDEPSQRTCEDGGEPVGTWTGSDPECELSGAGVIQNSVAMTTLLALVGVLASYLKI